MFQTGDPLSRSGVNNEISETELIDRWMNSFYMGLID